jgi:hypothetical protein
MDLHTCGSTRRSCRVHQAPADPRDAGARRLDLPAQRLTLDDGSSVFAKSLAIRRGLLRAEAAGLRWLRRPGR